MSLFTELKRRKVFRVAVVYAATAFVVLQVADIMLPRLGVPDWAMSFIVLLVALGFPVALVLAWALELTPEGIRVTAAATAADHTLPAPSLLGRRTVVAAAVLLVVGGGLGAGWIFKPGATMPGTADGIETAGGLPAVIADKSIAVLPFADFSAGGDQEWFADGLAEEILNALARTPDLQVSARTSSFRYKGSTMAVPEIAAELGVAYVLEGSVRSTPQRVRVTAQLIRAADGFHLWSQNYDRDVADMIEIQEDLARQIATAMQTRMDPGALADMAKVGTHSVEAYQAYLRGVTEVARLGPEEYRQAYAQFEQARALDPVFAAAHARAAYFWLDQLDPTSTLSQLTELTPVEAGRQFDERIELAIRHAGNETERLGYRALKADRDVRTREAIELYQAYLAQRPGDWDAIIRLMNFATIAAEGQLLITTLDALWPYTQTNVMAAVAHLNNAHRAEDRHKAAEQALVLWHRWPDHRPVLYQVHRALLWDRRVDDARAVLERMRAVTTDAENWDVIPPARQACAEGHRSEVEAAYAALPETDLAQRWHLLMLLGRHAEANELLRPLERAGNTFALASFLVYPQFDPTPFPSLRALLERERVQRPPPVPLPFACPHGGAAS
jgi:TolB-like protein